MGVESDADRLEFLNVAGFGETATCAGQSFQIDFRIAEIEQLVGDMTVRTRQPFGFARTMDLDAIPVRERSQVAIRGKTYLVKPGFPLDDGTGMSRVEFAL